MITGKGATRGIRTMHARRQPDDQQPRTCITE